MDATWPWQGAGGAQKRASPTAAAATCSFCSVPDGQGTVLRRCSGCEQAAYCSEEHQRNDWKRHKVLCKSLEARRNASIAAAGDVSAAGEQCLGGWTQRQASTDESSGYASASGASLRSFGSAGAVPLPGAQQQQQLRGTSDVQLAAVDEAGAPLPPTAHHAGADDDDDDDDGPTTRKRTMSCPMRPATGSSGTTTTTTFTVAQGHALQHMMSAVDSVATETAGGGGGGGAMRFFLPPPGSAMDMGVPASHVRDDHVQANRPYNTTIEQHMRQCGALATQPNRHQALAMRIQAVARHVVSGLTEFGWSIVDNFMGPTHGRAVLADCRRLYAKQMFSDGQLMESKDGGVSAKWIRSDKIYWFDNRDEATASSSEIRLLISVMDSVTTHLHDKLPPYRISGRSRAMIACYPGCGTRYVKHVDNPVEDGRAVTTIYYMNPSWRPEHGGSLRLYPATSATAVDIEPLFDRLIYFWSDCRVPHEVLPVYRHRFALTVWYFDAVEKARAMRRAELDNRLLAAQRGTGAGASSSSSSLASAYPPPPADGGLVLKTVAAGSGSTPAIMHRTIAGAHPRRSGDSLLHTHSAADVAGLRRSHTYDSGVRHLADSQSNALVTLVQAALAVEREPMDTNDVPMSSSHGGGSALPDTAHCIMEESGSTSPAETPIGTPSHHGGQHTQHTQHKRLRDISILDRMGDSSRRGTT